MTKRWASHTSKYLYTKYEQVEPSVSWFCCQVLISLFHCHSNSQPDFENEGMQNIIKFACHGSRS